MVDRPFGRSWEVIVKLTQDQTNPNESLNSNSTIGGDGDGVRDDYGDVCRDAYVYVSPLLRILETILLRSLCDCDDGERGDDRAPNDDARDDGVDGDVCVCGENDDFSGQIHHR
jgi:hypothetical protein